MVKLVDIDKDFYESDEFIELDVEAQLLYFHLLIRAKKSMVNNNRVVTNPKAIARMIQVDEDMIDNLVEGGYLLRLDVIDNRQGGSLEMIEE